MFVAHGLQLLLQHFPRLGDAPFHRPDRDAQHRRDLLVGVLAGSREQQHVPQLLRKRCDQSPQLRVELATDHAVFLRLLPRGNRGEGVPRAWVVRFPWGNRPLHPSHDALTPVDGLPPCNRQQPRAEGRVAAEGLQLSICGHEGILRHVLGVGCGSERRKDGAKHGATVAVHERAECIGVSRLRPAHQLDFHAARGVRRRHTACRGRQRHAGWEK